MVKVDLIGKNIQNLNNFGQENNKIKQKIKLVKMEQNVKKEGDGNIKKIIKIKIKINLSIKIISIINIISIIVLKINNNNYYKKINTIFLISINLTNQAYNNLQHKKNKR